MAIHFGILAGESHGQRSLAGYSLWGHTQLDTTEWLLFSSRSGRNVQLRKICESIATLSGRENKEVILSKSPSPRHRSRQTLGISGTNLSLGQYFTYCSGVESSKDFVYLTPTREFPHRLDSNHKISYQTFLSLGPGRMWNLCKRILKT